MRQWVTIGVLVVSWWGPARLQGQHPVATAEKALARAALARLPTVGREQFWSDELLFGGWRIQRHALRDNYRLLDASDGCRAEGSLESCRAEFEKAKQEQGLRAHGGRVVLVLHGLGRTREHMEDMTEYLRAAGGYEALNVTYASTRRPLEEHAESLARVIDGLGEIEELSFVCHSMGNLVVRRYLGEAPQGQARWRVDPRVKRMVMLGPPNQGSQTAEFFRTNELLGLVAGPSGKQLGRQWSETQPLLATPGFPFGILAGGLGNERGVNPFLPGDDDFLVAVEETRMAGASDFRLVPCVHGALMNDPVVMGYTLAFLKHGYFVSEEERQAIAAAPAAALSQASQP